MNIYTRILIITLPLFVIALSGAMALSYYYSYSALNNLAETWLDTRLSEAVQIAERQEKILHVYGLESIPASIEKAKMDAGKNMSAIQVGEKGFVFAVDHSGKVDFHPDPSQVGQDLSKSLWYKEHTHGRGRMIHEIRGERYLSLYQYFEPWQWFIVVSEPEAEVYGVAETMKPKLMVMGFICAVVIAVVLIGVTRYLTLPLKSLTDGAARIGQGDLSTRIPITSKDEFGRLAEVFNQMAPALEQTLKEVQNREDYFRSLVENASDIIGILDAEARFAYVSPPVTRILGYDQEKIVGNSLFNYIHPEDLDRCRTQFGEKIRNPETSLTSIEFRVRHQDGSFRVFESTNRNLLNHEAVQGVVVNARDITERKSFEQALQKSHQMLEQKVFERTRELYGLNKDLIREIKIRKEKERALEKANKAKSEFLANMSHEIRTPLNSIIGFSEVLMKTAVDTQQADYLKAIRTAGRNLLRQVNDILDLSKIEADMIEINRVPVNPTLLFQEIRQMFKVRMAEKGLVYAENLDASVPETIVADDVRLRQILMNLVGNSVKFTDKGFVRLSASTRPGSHNPTRVDLTFRVEDSGIGIEKENWEMIFESFRQASAGTTRKFGGTGLGLSISKRLVEMMGGRITVQSVPGKGSCFEIVLPDVETGYLNHPMPARDEAADRQSPYSDGIGSAPDGISVDDVPVDPELEKKIREDVLPTLRELQEGIKISTVQETAKTLRSLGSEFNYALLIKSGDSLLRFAEVFDIENINKQLNRLSKSLETILRQHI